jgi:hypothetical protein
MGALDPNRRTPSPPPFLAEDPDTEWIQWWRAYWHSLPVCCRSNPKDVPCKRHNPLASWLDLPSEGEAVEVDGVDEDDEDEEEDDEAVEVAGVDEDDEDEEEDDDDGEEGAEKEEEEEEEEEEEDVEDDESGSLYSGCKKMRPTKRCRIR